MRRFKKQKLVYLVILLIFVSLSIGFSALQRQLLIDDSIFNVRLQEDTRVSNNVISKTGGEAISNYEDYNVSKIYGSVTFPSTSSYVLYKVDLTNYGNVKTGLLGITSNTSGVNFQVCDSNGNNCSNDPKTSVCNGNSCTLGSTKSIYVKVTSTSTGTKNIDLDLDFEPYHTITYENFNENTSSFHTEIMENDTYEITLTSDVEEVGVTGSGNAAYDKNTHKLTISGVTGNITITAKYLATDVADTSYTGTDPDNYVRFNNTLYRIVTKETVSDGYGNNELRVKITKDESIGNNPFDSASSNYTVSSLASTLNTTFYNTLTNSDKDFIETVQWKTDYTNYVGIINKTDADNNITWLNQNQYTITTDGANIYAIIGGAITSTSDITTSRPTYPTMYLGTNVLISGGTGTRTNPYILELPSNGLIQNPTVVTGLVLTATGANQEIISVTNRVGTVYFGTSRLDETNYSTDGTTTIPQKSAVGAYVYYYYIPEGGGYKAKSGMVRCRINGIVYTINYQIGSNVDSIGKTTDSCTTSGTDLSCSVTLPSITPTAGFTSAGWNTTSGATTGTAAGASYTISNNTTVLYANAKAGSFIVEFNANGGTGGQTASVSATYGSIMPNINTTAPVKDGYTFTGWYDNQDSTSGTKYYNADGSSARNYDKTTGTTLYAGWEAKTYIVKYYLGNASSTAGSTPFEGTTTCTFGTACVLDSFTALGGVVPYGSGDTNHTNRYWVFYGWTNSTSSTTRVYEDLDAINPSTYSDTVNLYALVRHPLKFYGGVKPSSAFTTLYQVWNPHSTADSYRTTVTIPSPVTISGWTFKGYLVGSNGTGGSTTYSSSSVGTSVRPAINNSGYYRSVYQRTLRVNYDANGGSGTTAATTKTQYYNSGYNNADAISSNSITLASNNFTKEGHQFVAWAEGSVSGTQYNAGAAYTGIGTTRADTNITVTMYAIWSVDNPEAPTITGGTTKVYNYENTQLTCSTTSTYSTGTNLYYEFGYSETSGGTVTWLGSPSTTATYNVAKNAFRGTRFYTCRVYASDGTITSSTVTSTTDTSMTLTRARIDFDSTTNGGNVDNTYYVEYDDNSVYSNKTTTTTSTLSAPTKAGYTFDGWYTEASGGTKVINANGTLVASVSGWTNASGKYILNNPSDTANVNVLYAHFTANTYTATFYYYNGSAITTTTAQCTVSGGSTCTVAVPSAVSSSTGVYGSQYSNVSRSTSTLSSGSLTLSANTTFYAYYSSPLTIYYPNSSNSVSSNSTALYRNEYFTSNSAINTITATSNTSTTQATSISLSSLKGTLNGITPTINSATYYAVNNATNVINKTNKTFYAVTTADENVTFRYNSETTCGSMTMTSLTQAVTSTFYCQSTTQRAVSHGTTTTVPAEITTSNGQYGGTYRGCAPLNGLNVLSSFDGGSTYYAVYSSNVTNYYYNNSYTNRTLYRNEYLTTAVATDYKAVLATSNSSTTNISTAAGPGNSEWIGLSTAQDTTPEYTTVADAASSCDTTLYTVYRFNVTYSKGSNVSEIGSTTGSCNVTTNSTSCSVTLPSITPNTGFTSAGWNTESGAATGTAALSLYTVNSNPTTLYANAIGANYINTTTNESYQTLNEAFAAVGNNQTIKVLTNVTEASASTLASTKTGITLDLNGKTLMGSITNNGSLTLTSSASGGTIYSSVTNNGTLNVNTITMNPGIVNNSTGTLNVSSGTFNGGGMYGAYPIDNKGNCNITGGTFTSTSIAISNEGTLTISGSSTQISSANEAIYNDGGTISFSDATLTSNEVGITCGDACGTITINSGSITAGDFAIQIHSNAIINLGTNDGNVSTTSPVIETTHTSHPTIYGMGTVNFYDGVVKSANASTIGTSTTNTPTGYGVHVEINDGIRSAYLVPQKTATFYYNSNTTSGSLTVATATANCLVTSGTSCTVTVPSTVSNSVGKYNSAYKGVSTSTSSMGSSSLTISADTTFYANYSSAITIYYPNTSNGISSSSTALYRNEYFTSTTAMTTKTSTSRTSTTQATSVTLSNIKGTLSGITSTVNSSTSYAINNSTNVINKSTKTYYAVTTANENITFKYNSNTTCGSATVSNSTQAVSSTYYCESTSAMATTHGTTTTVPTEVSSSKGQYNSDYRAMAAVNSLTAVTTFTGGNTYYAVYSSAVTNYYYNSGYTSRTLYRNEYLASSSATTYTSVLATTNTGTTNITTSTGPNSSAFVGFSTAQDTTPEYSTVALAATSCDTTLYNVYSFSISYAIGSNVASIGATSGSCNLTTSSTSCNVSLPSITPTSGYTSVGWSPTSGATTGSAAMSLYSINSNSVTLYANAIIANYRNESTNQLFTTLNEAFTAVDDGQTITALADAIETTNATLDGGQLGITFDLDGHNITFADNKYISISPTFFTELTITSSDNYGEINGNANILIDNIYGTLNTQGVYIGNNSTNSSSIAIKNTYGTLNVHSYTRIFGEIGIYNRGYMSIYNESNIYIQGTTGIYNDPASIDCIIEINGGTISGCEIGINNANSNSYMTINNGTISSDSGWGWACAGEIDPVDDFKKSNPDAKTKAKANENVKTKANTKSSSDPTGINNNGYLTINDVTVEDYTIGIANNGELTILGGTITGNKYGINTTNGILTLGENDGTVSTTVPEIKSTDSSNSNGIYSDSTTLYFYDGVFKSSSGTGYSMQGSFSTTTPTGYGIYKETTSGVESATLRNTYTATIYYNSNTTLGGLTVSSTTVSCHYAGSSCEVTVPSVVTNSVGKYNSVYKGLSTSTGSMASSSLTISANTTFYANYSSALTINYPNSSNAISNTSTALYRNEYFTSASAMNTITANSNTSTTQATSVTLSSLKGTLSGITSTVNSSTSYAVNNAANVINTNATTYYAVTTANENVTFKYNSNTTCGSNTVTTTTTAVASTYYCSSTSAMATTHGTTTTVPTSVSSSVGRYNSAYRAVAAANSLTAVTTFTGGSTYYAVYSSNVTNYYYNSSYTSRTIYRNEYLASSTATSYTSRLATSKTSKTNYSTAAGPGSSVWAGLSTAQDITPEYSTVALGATSSTCATTLYTVYKFNVNYEIGTGVSAIGATTGSCNVTTSDTSCSVTLPTITPEVGYVSVGWNTTSGATTGTAALGVYTVNQNNLTLYANATLGNYVNTSTNVVYDTISDAFAAVQSNQTIKLLKDITDTARATLASGKTGVKFDLNGHILTVGDTSIISNNGGLDIYNSSSTQGKITGFVVGSLISSGGTLTLNGTSSANPLVLENTSSGTGLVVNFGGSGINTIYENVTLLSKEDGIQVTGPATVNIGVNDGTVNTNSPIISSLESDADTGVYASSWEGTPTLNFYDGVVTSKSGTGYAISYDIINTPTGYGVYRETISGEERAYLVANIYSATIYYNSDTRSGYLTTAKTYSSCTISGTSCTITVPTAVTSSVGKYNNPYHGLSGLESMTSDSLTLTDNAVFYANYSQPLTIYYPNTSDGVSTTSTALYRNEYFSDNETMRTVISNSQTGTTSVSSVNLPNRKGTYFQGLATAVNSTSSSAINSTNVISSNTSTYYAVTYENEYIEIRYNTGSACNQQPTGASAMQTVNTKYYCLNTTTMATSHGTSTTIPTNVSTSNGQYGGTYRGVAVANSLTPVTTLVGGSTYYAVYSSNVTNYYYNGSSYTSRTLYRNEYFANASDVSYTASLATTNNSTTNITTAAGPGSSVFTGYSNAQDITPEYTTVAQAATSCDTTLYTVYKFNVNYEIGANVSAIGAATGSCNVTTNSTSCSVTLPTITPEVGYSSVGWNTTSGATTGTAALSLYTLSSNPTTLYANAVGANYINTTTNEGYQSLNAAFLAVGNNQTIKVLQNVNEAFSSTLDSDKTGIKLDLNGKTISFTGVGYITNEGTLDVYNSSSTAGTITSSAAYDIDNYGILTINGTSNTNPVNIINTHSNGYCIYNDDDGSTTVNSNTRITSGAVGIYNDFGTITIGTNDGTVSTTSPIIESIGNASGSYGLSIKNGETLNFYDGIITSAAGTGKSISGTVSNTPTGYVVYKETTSGVESAYLRGQVEHTATFYYNSNTTSGSLTVSTATSQCTANAGESCTVTVPTAVQNSVGKYNSAYKGVSTSTSSMGSSSLTISADTTYYANYSSPLTIYYPNSSNAISNTSTALYRNEYFTSTTAMTTRTVTSNSSTTQATSITLSSIKGTLSGLTSTVNSSTSYAVNNTNVINTNATTFYAVTTANENVTFKYNNNNTCGSATVTTATQAVTSTYYCSSTSAMATAHGTTTTVPSAVSSSKGQYNSNYRAVASVNSLTAVSTFTGGSTYYAVYSSSVTNYYYSSSYTSRTLYRNEYLASSSATTYTARLATSQTSTSNYSTATGPGSSVWNGLSTSQDTTPEYSTVALAATSSTCATSLYTVYIFNVNYSIGSNVSAIGSTTGSCYVTTSDTSCSVTLPSITPNTGFVSVGWNTTSGATTGTAALGLYTISANPTTLFANATGGNYINTTTNESYSTLNEAFSAVGNNQTIKVLNNTTETDTSTLLNGKTGIVLDLNGKTISGSIINNNGNLTIEDSSNGSGALQTTLYNNGTATINSGTYNASSYHAIQNSGTLYVNGGTIAGPGATRAGIYNSGTAIITGGTISGNESGINNQATVTINAGTISGSTAGIHNYGTTTISGGNITGNSFGVFNQATDNQATVTINAGTISGSTAGIQNAGTLNVNDGTITANTGISNIVLSGSENWYGSSTIKGGTITGTASNGISVCNGCSLTLGENDSTVSTSSPIVQTTATSNSYGVSITPGGTFNFYDGIIKSASGTGKSIYGTVSNTPTGYVVSKSTTSGVESAILAKLLTATFYYNSNTTNGSLTVSTITAECTPTSGDSCTVTVPSEVTSSVGKYNSAYKGVSTSTSSMGSSSLTISANTTFYANYSSALTLYYPNTSNGISNLSSPLYRNEYFTSTSAMGAVTSTANNNTTQATSVTLSGLKGTFKGITPTVNSTTYYALNNATNVLNTNGTTYYVVTTDSEDVTFKYNSNATCGSNTVTTTTSQVTSTYYCSSTSAMATTHGTTTTVPTVVSGSVGRYNSAYRAVALVNSLTAVTTFTGGSTYYAVYSSPVTNYYYNSGYTNRTLYRNEYLGNTTATNYVAVLATSQTLKNYFTETSGPGSSALAGYSTAQDISIEYGSTQSAASSNTCATTLYTVYRFNVNYEIGANVSSTGAYVGSCDVTTSDTSCDVTLPTITPNSGYVSVGWNTTSGATTGTAAGQSYTISSNITTLYANAVVAYYQNTTTNESYQTLNEAFSAVSNNQTIKVLQNKTETTVATLASGKTGVKLDLNGKTITVSGISSFISNNGTLDIYNSSSTTGTISANQVTINNSGTLTLNGTSTTNTVVINASQAASQLFAINNSSLLTVNDNVQVSSSAFYAIDNKSAGTLTITGGTISGSIYGISNAGTLNVSGNNTQISATRTSNSAFGIDNRGTATITGGTISSPFTGISNAANAELTISGSSTQITCGGTGINNSGELTITNGTIIGNERGISNNAGTVSITNGTIMGYTVGIYDESSSGEITITGGHISEISITSTSELTLGTNDSTVSGLSPLIEAVNQTYGVSVASNGTFNFYDGVIKSSAGTGYAINRNPNNIPTGYTVYKETISGTESAYLTSNYYNVDTGLSYSTLSAAMTAVANNQTIKVMTNTSETAQATLAAGKTGIKLDLNGKTITYDTTYLRNNGELDIYNSSSTNGKITGAGTYTVYNYGTLTTNDTANTNTTIIENTKSSSGYSVYVYSAKAFTMNNNTQLTNANGYGVLINGTANINGGSITGTYAIGVNASGVLYVNGGTITGTGTAAINNSGTATITDGTMNCSTYGINNNSGGTLTIDGGSISGATGLYTSGTTTINGGTITGTTNGIGTSGSGTTTILGGEITGATNAINIVSGSTVTLGENDGNVSTTVPSIRGTGTSNTTYGVLINSGGIFNFYDGVVFSARRASNTVSGTLTDVADGHKMTTTNTTGGYNATLTPVNYQNMTTKAGYDTLYDALNAVASNQTIKVWADTTETTAASLASGKTGVKLDLNGHTITTSTSTLITNNGTLDIYNSSSESTGIITSSNSYIIRNNSVLNISAVENSQSLSFISTVRQTSNSYNIYNYTGTLNLGSDDDSISTTSPNIQANGRYAIRNANNATFNFYDGVLSSGYGTNGYIINGTVSNTPTDYAVVYETVSGVEYARLEAAYTYKNLDTGNTYDALNNAFNTVLSNQTIKVLKDATETNSPGVASSKTGVKLDLNGKTITLSSTYLGVVGGLDIYNSSSAEGKITASGIPYTLYNNGTLTINGTSSANTTVIENTTTGNTTPIYSDSSATINNNTQLRSTNGYGLYNAGTLNINGGSINGSIGLHTSGNSTINTGTITGSNYGIETDTSGTTTILGGTIKGTTNGINIGSGTTVTLGTNDGNISTTSPVIQATGNSSTYGINNSGTFNFYDGVIKSASGNGYSIYGTVTNVATNHMVQKELDEGVENAYLVFKNVLMTATYGNGTANFLRTNVVKSNIETITFTNSVGNHTVNGTNCFDVSRDENGSVLAWVTDNDSDGLKEITIGANGNIFAESGYYLLSFLTNVTQINGLEYLDTSEVTTMEGMFSGSSKITSLDLGDFNTSSVTNMNSMFKDCSLLNAVYVTNSFVVTSVTNSTNMFANCTNIEGGAGTTYNSSYIDKARAKIDGGTSSPGYFIQRVQYTATFMTGSHVTSIGTGSTKCTLLRGNTSCSVLLPSITAETNYSPVGWSTTNGATTGSAALTLYSISSNTTLYGNARGVELTVTFNANGGSGLTASSKTVYYGETYGELPTINSSSSCENYSFVGWYDTSNSSGGNKIQSTTNVTSTTDHTLWARRSWNGNWWGECANGGSYNYSTGKCTASNYTLNGYNTRECYANGYWAGGPGSNQSCDTGYTKIFNEATGCGAWQEPTPEPCNLENGGPYEVGYLVYRDCVATCQWNGDYNPTGWYCW